MTGAKWTAEDDALLSKLDSEGLTAEEIAVVMGRTRTAILLRRRKIGLAPRIGSEPGTLKSSLWLREFEARLGEPADSWLKRRYVDEKASYRELTKEAGINTRTLMKLMKSCNIEPISGKEAFRRQLEKDPELVTRMIRAGSTKEAAAKRAISRQENWKTRFSPLEFAFLDALNAAGLFPTPELAVGTYNIDFAFSDQMLAVEYDPRWHTTSIKRPRDEKRDAILKSLGWEILRIESRASHKFNVKKVSDALRLRASTQPR